MNWLPWPIIPKRLWPEVRFKERRAITSEEHQLIIGREKNRSGAASTNCAGISAVRKRTSPISRRRTLTGPTRPSLTPGRKTGSLAMIHFGPDIETSCGKCRQPARCFPICNPFAVATAPRSSSNDAMDWASRACRCTLTATLGRSGRRYAATRSGCTRSPRTQQQGHSPRLRPQGASQTAFAGKLRKQNMEGRIVPLLPPLPKPKPMPLVFGGWLREWFVNANGKGG